MSKYLRIYTCALIIFGLLWLPVTGFGQDLGSSSGIFKNPKAKKSATKAPSRRAASKPRTARAKKAVSRSPQRTARISKKSKVNSPLSSPPKSATESATESTTELPAETPAEVAVTETEPLPPTPSADIVITVGEKTSGDFNEIFEKSIEEGNAARDAREYTKAESAYLRARSLQSKDSRAVYGLGNLYSDQQRWEEAERAYRTAMEIEPTAPESYIALSFVLTQPIIGTNLAKRYTEAEKHARKAVELDPKNAFAYDQLGVTLELGGKIGEETQASYRKAIELEPSSALAYAHLGRLLIKTGLTEESAAAYSQSIKLAADVPTMILVADVMQSQQKYTESEQLLRRALKEDEKNPTALHLLGRALTVSENYDEAEKVLKKSAEVSPNSFVSYTLLGTMFVRRKKFADAEKYLMKAVKIVTENEKKRLAQEFEAVGDGYLRIGKNKDAIRVLRQARTLDMEKTGLAEKLAKAQVN